MQITKESVDQFWAHAAEHTDWAAYHEGFGAMPLGLHGDDGRYNMSSDKVILVTLNFVLSRDVSRHPAETSLLFFIPTRLRASN